MSRINAIRVATDFSDNAAQAIQRAGMVANASGIDNGLVLHALDAHRVRAWRDLLPVLAGLERHQTEECEKKLQASVEELKAQTGAVFKAALQEGDTASAVLKGAAGHDLIVIGARGASGVKDILLGSTAEKVVRRTGSPVLVVRREAKADYDKVVVGVDFSDDSKAALKLAAELAPNATLYPVHAYLPAPEVPQIQAPLSKEDISSYRAAVEKLAHEEMQAMLEECGIDSSRAKPMMDYGYAPMVVREKAREIGAGLIVMGRHGDRKLSDWLLGSVTMHVLNSADTDVLVV